METKRKFTKPPVKLACLSCRASRIRCDGKKCTSKGKECTYLPSKRGGPRRRKNAQPAASQHKSAQIDQGDVQFTPDPEIERDEALAIFNAIDVLSEQGRGIKEVPPSANTQKIVESIKTSAETGTAQAQFQEDSSTQAFGELFPRVRLYGGEQEILSAYYVFIHNYYPILPPPPHLRGVDSPLNFPTGVSSQGQINFMLPYEPKSPASLAISAILALLPHPRDPNPFSAESIQLRKGYSNHFARAAIDRVEQDHEIEESDANPAGALQQQFSSPKRPPLHPFLPVELEVLIALMILSVYEYAQRGNCTKMRIRAGEAYILAMGMGLHKLGLETDMFTEGRRRAWWMTYYILSQCGVVSTSAQLVPLDPAFTTPFPSFPSDPEAWSIFFESQQILMTATQFVKDQKAAIKSSGSLTDLCERMRQLDSVIQSNLVHSHLPSRISVFQHHDNDPEIVTAQCMRHITQVKLYSSMIKAHRFRAFSDIAIFIKKHCDLDAAEIVGPASQPPPQAGSPGTGESTKLSCCSSMGDIPLEESSIADSGSTGITVPDGDMLMALEDPTLRFEEGGCSFSNEESSQKCFDAALGISQIMGLLPYPQPCEGNALDNVNLRSSSCPLGEQSRTMPLFCCCIMQSSYAMLMLYYKYRVMDDPSIGDDLTPALSEKLREDVQRGLQTNIKALENYSKAFEALDGMRDLWTTLLPQRKLPTLSGTDVL
ncbi:hypothetical protein KEM56_000844 [Ascosphaera pollenicola]|nr:hypothetical protein KEM56_000844 [Ascosphaera pollenicola]